MSRRRSSNFSLSMSSSSSVSSRSSSFRSLSSPSDELIISPPITPLHHCNQLSSSPSSNSTRKAHIPFSWEHLPGVPKNQITITPPPLPLVGKSTTLHCNTKSHSPSSSGGSSSSSSSSSPFSSQLPLPPSSKSKDARKQSSGSSKNGTPTSSGGEAARNGSLISSEDPFLAALMECSKDTNDNTTEDNNHGNHNHRRGTVVKGGGRSVGRSISNRFPVVNLITSLDQFSCKRSCGVLSEYIVVQKGYVRHG